MGLDLSLRSAGVVVLAETGSVVYAGSVGLDLKSDTAERERIERLIWIANRIIRVAKENEVGHVGIEGYAFGAFAGRERLGELHGVVKTQLWMARHVEPVVVPPSSARHMVFGPGMLPRKKPKPVILAMLKSKGIEFPDDDQADAYVIARYMLWRVATDGTRGE